MFSAALGAALAAFLAAPAALAHEEAPRRIEQRPLAGPDAAAPVVEVPPAPEGVTHIDFAEFFKKPVGRRGLEYSESLRALDGKRVRVLGYMVGTDEPAPGLLMLAPFPIHLHESEYGMADDLPPSALHVIAPALVEHRVAFAPGPLLVTGKLELGFKAMSDGRNSPLRIVLDAADTTFTAAPGTAERSDDGHGHHDHDHDDHHDHHH